MSLLSRFCTPPRLILKDQSFYILEFPSCKTVAGTPCEMPFRYGQYFYDSCINIDNDGEPWCYVNITQKKWGKCDESTCPYQKGL